MERKVTRISFVRATNLMLLWLGQRQQHIFKTDETYKSSYKVCGQTETLLPY